MQRLAVAVLAAAFALVSVARADDVIKKPVAADTPDKFADLVKELHDEMGEGGRYEFIKPDERRKVDADLDSMQGLLVRSGSVDKMKMDDRLRLFNTQEHVNGILVHNDANRLVCERRAPVGTTIPQTTCKTVGDIERARRNTNDYLQRTLLDASKCASAACRGN